MNNHRFPMPHGTAEPDPEWLAEIRRNIERAGQLKEARHRLANKLMIEWGRAQLLREQTRRLTGRA